MTFDSAARARECVDRFLDAPGSGNGVLRLRPMRQRPIVISDDWDRLIEHVAELAARCYAAGKKAGIAVERARASDLAVERLKRETYQWPD